MAYRFVAFRLGMGLLGAEVVNVAHHRKAIKDAIDFLVDGF
jgi:hypothetical protein